MPKTRHGASTKTLEDLTGALKTQRWNYCEAIARKLYRSNFPTEQLHTIFVQLDKFLKTIIKQP